TGPFTGTMTFPSGPPALTTTNEIAFVMALDASGNALWAKLLDLGAGGVVVGAAADPSDNGFVLAGYSTGPATFGTCTGTDGGGQDIVVAKVKGDATGDLLWARQIGGTGDQAANGVTVDATGHVFIVGVYRTGLDLGNGALPAPTGTAQNIFIGKLDGAATGNALAAVAIAPSVSGARPKGNAIAVASTGHVVIGGQGNGARPIDATHTLMLAPSGPDGFVARLAPDLSAVWARRIGDTDMQTAIATQVVNGVAVAGSGDVIAVGNFAGVVDFGTGPL